jgi:hypothetical protein
MTYLTEPATDALLERFWAKVDTSGECWLWTASVGTTGYGQFRMGLRTVKAHRLSWELAEAPIPAGFGVLHFCDMPRCVRPDHLFLGTQADNMADAARKGRVRNSPRQGEANRAAKLTDEQVRLARGEHQAGAKIRQLARRFGVHPKTMRRALLGETWSHV